MRTDTRTEVRCEKCLTSMEKREHELRFVCRNDETHSEPFRDDRGIITKRTRGTPTPTQEEPHSSEPEPSALSLESIARLREQIPTDNRATFDTVVESAERTHGESVARIKEETDTAIMDATERQVRSIESAQKAKDKKIRAAFTEAMGVEQKAKRSTSRPRKGKG